MLYEALTPYEGILQMPAAGHLTWTPEFSSLDIYWDRTSLPKPLPHKDPMHYQTLFRDTLSACVSSMLRSAEHTGCTLSSGLDSSAIAALAAPRLAEMGEQLYSYTSVPLRDFVPEGTEPRRMNLRECWLPADNIRISHLPSSPVQDRMPSPSFPGWCRFWAIL